MVHRPLQLRRALLPRAALLLQLVASAQGFAAKTRTSWPDTFVLSGHNLLDADHAKLLGTYKLTKLAGRCNGAPVYKGQGSIDETWLYRHKNGDKTYWAIGEGSAAKWNANFDCRINAIAFESSAAPSACSRGLPSDRSCAHLRRTGLVIL